MTILFLLLSLGLGEAHRCWHSLIEVICGAPPMTFEQYTTAIRSLA
jgi:hypothetical protein